MKRLFVASLVLFLTLSVLLSFVLDGDKSSQMQNSTTSNVGVFDWN